MINKHKNIKEDMEMEFIKSIFVYIFRGGIILSFILLCLNKENKNIIIDDYDNNSKVIGQRKFNVMNLQKLLLYKRTFRNVIFHRLSEFHVSKVLKILFKFFYSLSPAVYVFGKFGGGPEVES